MTVVGPSLLPRSQLYWIALNCTKSGFQCWHSNKCQGDVSTVVISVFQVVRARIMWCASMFNVPSNTAAIFVCELHCNCSPSNWPTRDASAYFCSVRSAVDSNDRWRVQTYYGKQIIKQKSLFWDMSPAERLKVLLFLALFFGAVGFLFTLLSCGTEYWLLATESCSRSEDRNGVSGLRGEEQNIWSETSLFEEHFKQ